MKHGRIVSTGTNFGEHILTSDSTSNIIILIILRVPELIVERFPRSSHQN
jgi:hypothetical protein